MRVDLQPAYILHARPYRDTSLLLDLFSPDHGRVTAVARGARATKGKRQRQQFNPFQRLLINWQGKSSFKLITAAEPDKAPVPLQGKALFSGFYLNELLVYLLPEHDLIADLFERYDWTLNQLAQAQSTVAIEPLLREFEFMLLQGLGYGLDFTSDCQSLLPIHPNQFYLCDSQQGFYVAPAESDPRFHLAGSQLLAIASGDYREASTCRAAKQLSRQLLRPLLGGRRLKSRDLFISL